MQRPVQLALNGAESSRFPLRPLSRRRDLISPPVWFRLYGFPHPLTGILTRSSRTGLPQLPGGPCPRRPIPPNPGSGLGRMGELHPQAPVVAAPASLQARGFSGGCSEVGDPETPGPWRGSVLLKNSGLATGGHRLRLVFLFVFQVLNGCPWLGSTGTGSPRLAVRVTVSRHDAAGGRPFLLTAGREAFGQGNPLSGCN